MFGDAEGLHIADPAAPTGMYGIADLVLAFQEKCARSLSVRRFGGGLSVRAAAHNLHINVVGHRIPSMKTNIEDMSYCGIV